MRDVIVNIGHGIAMILGGFAGYWFFNHVAHSVFGSILAGMVVWAVLGGGFQALMDGLESD